MSNTYFNLNGPEKPPWALLEKLISGLIWIASYNEDILRKHCPSFEYTVAVAIGCVAVVGMIFNAVVFGIAGHVLFGSANFSFGLSLGGLLLALMIASIESYGGRSAQVPMGVNGLTRSGLALSRPERFASSLPVFGFYRAGIAVLTAFVVTVCLSLGIYGPDIAAKTSMDVRDGNHAIYQQADRAYEQELRRLSDAEQGQSALVADLEREVKRLRQDVVRKSVAGARRGGSADGQFEKFEKKLADEKLKLDGFRQQSLKLVQSRNANVAQMVEASPEKVQRQEGLIGRLAALHALIMEKPSVLLVVIAIDLLLAGLDCAGVIVRLCAPTPIYSAFIAKTSVLGSVQQSKDCADQLAVYQPDRNATGGLIQAPRAEVDGPPLAMAPQDALSNHISATPQHVNGAAIIRRPRGRPRKDAKDRLNSGEAA